jgi:hypothetical protein
MKRVFSPQEKKGRKFETWAHLEEGGEEKENTHTTFLPSSTRPLSSSSSSSFFHISSQSIKRFLFVPSIFLGQTAAAVVAASPPIVKMLL